jgi:hypothetical protein
VRLNTDTKGQVNVQFRIRSASSIGTVAIDTPIGTIQFHVVQVDTPFLLCLADMDDLKVYFNNLQNVLITPTKTVPVVRQFGHPFLLWHAPLQTYLIDSLDQNPCYLTEVELRRLHRRFGHPSVEKLKKLLDSTGHNVDTDALQHLTKYCHFCQKHSRSPGRFRFTIQDDIDFNYSIIVDIMYISGEPLLHIVDESTRFQAGRWLQNLSAKHT